jgi:hypothetical protein
MKTGLLCTLICLSLASGCASKPKIGPTGSILQPLRTTDVNGRTHQPLDGSSKATVLIFITNDCPIANGYAPEINSIIREYSGLDVRFFLVHVDQKLRLEQAMQHAREYGFQAPVIMDEDRALTSAVQATVTPEAAVLDQNAILVYRGRIDDRYVDFGKKRTAPSQRDLREAIDAVIAGRQVAVARTKAIGCFIPDEP